MNAKKFYDWLHTEQEREPKADSQVLDFIYRFRTSQIKSIPDSERILKNQFLNGYCYYFAAMLKTAFKRGEICWAAPSNHIVWMDENGVPYDIGGVTVEKAEDWIPEYMLGNTLRDFLHIPGDLQETTDQDIKTVRETWALVKSPAFSYHGKNVTELSREEAESYLRYPFAIQDDLLITWMHGQKQEYLKRKFGLQDEKG